MRPGRQAHQQLHVTATVSARAVTAGASWPRFNKCESLHALKRDLLYAHEGTVRARHLEQQTEQAWCLTLVTNAVITWTTEYYGLAVASMRRCVRRIDDEVPPHISPVEVEHTHQLRRRAVSERSRRGSETASNTLGRQPSSWVMTHPQGEAPPAMSSAGSAARWISAYAFAVTGDVSYFLVLSWAAVQAGGPLWSGLVLAAGAIPRAVLMLPGGVLVDRVGPRRLVVGSDALRSGVMLLAALMALVARTQPWWLLVVAIIFGIVDAVFMPAVGAMPASLVPAGQLKRLQAWRLAAVRVSNAVGPAVGALLIAHGASTAFAVLAFAFAASAILLLTVRIRVFNDARAPATAARPRLRSTIPEIRQQRGLGRLVTGTALTDLPFSGPVAVGIVLLTQERQWPVTTAGGALTVFSIAGLLASLLCAVAPARLTGKTTAVAATAGTAFLLICISLVPTTLAAVITSAALGLTSGTTTAICHGQIQQHSPRQMLGRVTAVLSLLTLGLSPALYAGAGATASAVGIEPFFYTAAAIALLAVGILASTPPLRD